MKIEQALGWLNRYANGFTEDNERYSPHSFDLSKDTSDTLINFIKSKLAEEVGQGDCEYCHFDENLQCSQDWFAHSNDDVEIGLSSGGSEVVIIYRNGEEYSTLVTQCKYCPYCGRRIR